MRWDTCNKWLYFGRSERWTMMFDNWVWRAGPSIRQWTLFEVMWDTGAWWAFDLDNALVMDGLKCGWLQAFFQVTIFGVGIRRWYKIKVKFDEAGFRESLRR